MASEIPEFGSAYAAEQLRRSRHPLRRLIKKFYLDRVLGEVGDRPTIDFGCGAGQLRQVDRLRGECATPFPRQAQDGVDQIVHLRGG